MKMIALVLVLGVMALGTAGELSPAQAAVKTVRATALDAKAWHQLKNSAQTVVVEFRMGDLLPVTLQAQGDFIETTETGSSTVLVKRPFWIEVQGNQVLISLDGSSFRPIGDAVNANFSAQANTGESDGGIASAIGLIFSASVK